MALGIRLLGHLELIRNGSPVPLLEDPEVKAVLSQLLIGARDLHQAINDDLNDRFAEA